jgi:isopenicillin N synthase-like dioxygenase
MSEGDVFMNSIHTVPIIDIKPFLDGNPEGIQEVVRQVRHACETIGFLILTDHGIDPNLQSHTFRVCQEFFDLSETEKLKYHSVLGTY